MNLRSSLRRLGRAVGDVALTVGMGRGAAHGGSRHLHADHLLARAALFDEGARGHDRDTRPGLLDRVPGWVLLLAVALLVAGVLVFTTWQVTPA
jgi:hypothetical protein